MPSCCVLGCKNYYQKGFSMRPLPTNSTRRELWISKIGKKDWELSKKWFICEMHFSEDMWEKPRIDGKRKLKHNAVPMIFDQLQESGTSAGVNNQQSINFCLSYSETRKNIAAPRSISITTDSEMEIQPIINSTLESALLKNTSSEQFTEMEVESTTQNNISELSVIPCEQETIENSLVKKLKEAESNARQAKLEAEEANHKTSTSKCNSKQNKQIQTNAEKTRKKIK